MKILLIDYDAGTQTLGGDTHAYDLAKQWKQAGEIPLIVAADYSYLRKENPASASGGQMAWQDDLPFLWIPSPPAQDREKKILHGALPFGTGIRQRIPQITQWGPDVVMLSSRHLLGYRGGLKIAERLQIPLLFDVRRIYPEHLEEMLSYPPNHYLTFLFRRAQKKLYTKSSRILSIYPALADHIQALGADPSRFATMPQAIAPCLSAPHEPPEHQVDFIQRYRRKGYFVCVYGGEVEKGRGLTWLLEAASQAPAEILFMIAGNGVYKAALKRKAKQQALTNVLFLDGVAPAQWADLYQAADCVYVGMEPRRWHQYGADASCILQAMYSGSPLICAARIPQNPVALAKCGQVVPPKDPQALIDALEQLRAMPAGKRAALGRRGAAYVEQSAGISQQAAAYLRQCRQAIRKS